MKRSHIIDLLWRVALQEAIRSRFAEIEPEHFLEALTKGNDFCQGDILKELESRGFDAKHLVDELRFAPGIFTAAGVNPVQLRRDLRAELGAGNHDHQKGAIMHRSARTKEVFSAAEKIAKELGCKSLNAGVLLLAILSEPAQPTIRILTKHGMSAEKIKDLVLQKLQKGPAGLDKNINAADDDDSEAVPSKSMLEKFGRDLTQAAKDGLLPPVIGRRKELLQVIQTLGRSSKSNPVLIGEAGVGKTAIVEALAQRAAAGKEKLVLGGRRIIEINMSSLVAGTSYRGEFEERMQKLVAEVKADPGIILFVDEIHTMVGAGDRNGPMDAANIMKPALARGDFKCIGATTIAEYRKFIEKDPALERRFNKVIVNEPTRDETIEILKGLRPRFEKHHNTKISDEAIDAAVDLTIRFDNERYLPDKAVDVLDLACVQISVPDLSIQVKAGQGSDESSVGVDASAIVAVLAEKYGIPEEVISGGVGKGNQNGVLELRENLKKRIMGQDEAIEQVYRRLRLSYAALSERRRPLGVFLFLGPSGVGKTELARALADNLFGSAQSIIRVDMSEYMEPHNVSRLIGSPPGYVGHDEEGQLTEKLRKTPHAIVLLDEVEKAHPKVLDLFLQVFDEGRITDGKGKTIDAKNAVFIMTSNLGSKEPVKRPAALGFNAADPEPENAFIHEDVKKHFRTELISRIDAIIRFNTLSEKALHAIAEDLLEKLKEALLEKRGIVMSWEPRVIAALCQNAHSAEYGARNLKRVVQEYIELPLLDKISNEPEMAYIIKEISGGISVTPHLDL